MTILGPTPAEVVARLDLWRDLIAATPEGCDTPFVSAHGPMILYHGHGDAADALAWLRRHIAGARTMARAAGATVVAVDKQSGDYYGVKVRVRRRGLLVVIDVSVPADATCELVDTGETRFIPAMPAQYEPVMERRCPPSIYAGIADEAVPA